MTVRSTTSWTNCMMMTVRKTFFMLMTMITVLMRMIPVRWNLSWRMTRMRMKGLSQNLLQ